MFHGHLTILFNVAVCVWLASVGYRWQQKTKHKSTSERKKKRRKTTLSTPSNNTVQQEERQCSNNPTVNRQHRPQTTHFKQPISNNPFKQPITKTHYKNPLQTTHSNRENGSVQTTQPSTRRHTYFLRILSAMAFCASVSQGLSFNLWSSSSVFLFRM